EDERVGVEVVGVAYKLSSFFTDVNAKITEITDRFVATATDIRKEAADWFDLPLKMTAHIDSVIRSVARVERLLEVNSYTLFLSRIVLIVKFVFEAVYETIDVCVFCNKRPRRILPLGTANRTASLPFIWRTERKQKIESKEL
ncbi:hypothetical protein PMAYCL1PPCAC_07788, partial [Pristionchus mayeri]